MGASYVQTSFLGGEWSKTAQGRMDDPNYRKAMNVCENGIILTTGAWTRRPGFEFIARTRFGLPANLQTFDFTGVDPYVLEFTEGNMRLYANGMPYSIFNGTVSNISSGSPAVVTTSAPHQFSTNREVFFSLESLGARRRMGIVYKTMYRITVTSPTTFNLYDSYTGDPVDGSTLGWDGSLAGGAVLAKLVGVFGMPFTADEAPLVRIVQTDDTAFILQGRHRPLQLTVTTQPTASAPAVFRLDTTDFIDGPYLDPPPPDGPQASATTGNPFTVNFVAGAHGPNGLQEINEDRGFLPTDIGRAFRIQTTPPDWVASTSYSPGNYATYQGVPYQKYAGGASASTVTPNVDPNWAPAPDQLKWHSARIINVTGIGQIVCQYYPGNDEVVFTKNTTNWRLGAYSDTTGWPTCGCWHDGRLWLAGAIKNRVDASMSNRPDYFSPTNKFGQVADDNGISAVFNSDKANPVFWMQPGEQGIICGTQSGEWLVHATANNLPITPFTVQPDRITGYGSANVEPQSAGLTNVFVQRHGLQMNEYLADAISGRYFGPNIADMAQHITKGGVSRLAYQKQPVPILWGHTAEGKLFGITYRRTNTFSNGAAEFVAWNRHPLGDNRPVTSLAVGPSTTAGLQTITIVQQQLDGSHNVLIMRDIITEDEQQNNDALLQSTYMDSLVIPISGVSVTSPDPGVKFQGLHHLESQPVAVYACGVDCGQFVVTNGCVTVPFNESTGFTKKRCLELAAARLGGTVDFEASACEVDGGAFVIPCAVGFSYASRGQILRPIAAEQTGTRNGPAFAKIRRNHGYGALVLNSVGVKFGTDFSKLRPANYQTDGGRAYRNTELFSGLWWRTIDDKYSLDGMLCWEIARPYPTTILAIGGFIDAQDK